MCEEHKTAETKTGGIKLPRMHPKLVKESAINLAVWIAQQHHGPVCRPILMNNPNIGC